MIAMFYYNKDSNFECIIRHGVAIFNTSTCIQCQIIEENLQPSS